MLVTAPLRGDALDELREIADVVFDPWIEHQPIKLYRSGDFAARIQAEGADIVVCEADSCKGPVLELPLIAIGCTRARPGNVDVDAATSAGIPVLSTPGRNADAVAEMTVALLMAVNRFVVAGGPRTCEPAPCSTRPSRTSATGPGRWRDGPRAWWASAQWREPRNGVWRASA